MLDSKRRYLRPLAAVALLAAGVLGGGLLQHWLPTPQLLPNTSENDGSDAVAFIVFAVGFSTWIALGIDGLQGIVWVVAAVVIGLGIGVAL
jgi:hypothetical protein